MSTKYFYSWNRIVAKLLFALLISAVAFTACKDEVENAKGDPFFTIEGQPTGITVDIDGITQSYVVRSNRSWKIIPDQEVDWARTFPEEGEDDGIFKVIVDENPTFDLRTVNFSFIVDGEEQAVMFRVDQEKNTAFIDIENAAEGISIPSAGGEVDISIDANVDWVYALDDESWLTEQAKSESELKLMAEKNWGPKRSVTLTVTSPDFPDLSAEVVITQSSGSVILEEDFSWLNYGSSVPYETSGEKRYDSWTEEEKNMGWYVTPNQFANNQQVCYARVGFVKLGKTNYGGDLISPKLELDGPTNVKVTFKAANYISANGNIDDKILKIYALGAGEPSVSELIIDNVPNSQAEDEAGKVNDIWDPERAYSFTITGATSETQIKLLGGDYDLRNVGQGKNRIFIDDIKVEIIN
jgi:hypothetical protein